MEKEKGLLKTQLNKENLHHAYLLDGAFPAVLAELEEFLEGELGFAVKANPDFWLGEFETFGIDDGRKIKEMQSRTASSGDKKIFIISANFITREAQNALLKMFEEPTAGTHFFIITTNTNQILPTLKSRLQILSASRSSLDAKADASRLDLEARFLKVSKAKRLEFLKSTIEEKDKQKAIEFLNGLEQELAKDVKKYSFALEEIQKARGYLSDRGSSVKMLLEHIATIL